MNSLETLLQDSQDQLIVRMQNRINEQYPNFDFSKILDSDSAYQILNNLIKNDTYSRDIMDELKEQIEKQSLPFSMYNFLEMIAKGVSILKEQEYNITSSQRILNANRNFLSTIRDLNNTNYLFFNKISIQKNFFDSTQSEFYLSFSFLNASQQQQQRTVLNKKRFSINPNGEYELNEQFEVQNFSDEIIIQIFNERNFEQGFILFKAWAINFEDACINNAFQFPIQLSKYLSQQGNQTQSFNSVVGLGLSINNVSSTSYQLNQEILRFNEDLMIAQNSQKDILLPFISNTHQQFNTFSNQKDPRPSQPYVLQSKYAQNNNQSQHPKGVSNNYLDIPTNNPNLNLSQQNLNEDAVKRTKHTSYPNAPFNINNSYQQYDNNLNVKTGQQNDVMGQNISYNEDVSVRTDRLTQHPLDELKPLTKTITAPIDVDLHIIYMVYLVISVFFGGKKSNMVDVCIALFFLVCLYDTKKSVEENQKLKKITQGALCFILFYDLMWMIFIGSHWLSKDQSDDQGAQNMTRIITFIIILVFIIFRCYLLFLTIITTDSQLATIKLKFVDLLAFKQNAAPIPPIQPISPIAITQAFPAQSNQYY